MRRIEGREAWHRLLEWDKGQAPSERLAALLLSNEGFKNVDPSHPLGGKDGLKDMMLSYNGSKWIGAVYFPRGVSIKTNKIETRLTQLEATYEISRRD